MQVQITRISRQQKTSKAGKSYMSVGIQTQEHGSDWLNGFENEVNKNWQEGDTVEIIVEKNDKWLNFSTPKATDLLEDRIKSLEDRVTALEK